jgi:hypothetical protein
MGNLYEEHEKKMSPGGAKATNKDTVFDSFRPVTSSFSFIAYSSLQNSSSFLPASYFTFFSFATVFVLLLV